MAKADDHTAPLNAMADILILYSTTDGHTLKISERLKQVIESNRHRVTVKCLDDAADVDPQPYDKIVLGASIRYGKHNRSMYDYIRSNRQALDDRPNAFFSVNVVARKPEKRSPETNPYLKKFLREITWQPKEVTVFAGRLDYPRYSYWDRQIIRMIMWITKGPTAPDTVIEYTDWDQVEAFGRRISEM